MIKKIYTAPSTTTIEVETIDVLLTSRIPVDGETDKFDTDKQRNDWDDIWKK